MPDLDRTTLENLLTHEFMEWRRSLSGGGDKGWSHQDGVRLVKRLTNVLSDLMPAPSEAPAEAFTATELETLASNIDSVGMEANEGNRDEVAMALRQCARLVRERHTFIGDASALWHKQVCEEADAQAKVDELARSAWNICQCGHSRTNHGDGDSPPCLIAGCGCKYFVLVVRERHTGKG